MLKFFLYFLTMSEDVRIGLIVFFVVNRLIASAVSALMARRRGRTPWKWALTSLLLGWIGFITVCVSKNITEEETDNLGDYVVATAIFLGIAITWATYNYVERIGLMPWIDTVEEVKDLFSDDYKTREDEDEVGRKLYVDYDRRKAEKEYLNAAWEAELDAIFRDYDEMVRRKEREAKSESW